jgi:hypothetical protein
LILGILWPFHLPQNPSTLSFSDCSVALFFPVHLLSRDNSLDTSVDDENRHDNTIAEGLCQEKVYNKLFEKEK